MNKVAAVGTACVLLSGLFMPARVSAASPPPGPCGVVGANDRCIAVSITTTGGARIADIPDVRMPAAGIVIWHITTPGYHFTARGIDFVNVGTPPPGSPPKMPGPAASTEFSGCSPMPADDTRYTCRNSHGHHKPAGEPYPYKVTVTGPVAVPPKDPFIVNH